MERESDACVRLGVSRRGAAQTPEQPRGARGPVAPSTVLPDGESTLILLPYKNGMLFWCIHGSSQNPGRCGKCTMMPAQSEKRQ